MPGGGTGGDRGGEGDDDDDDDGSPLLDNKRDLDVGLRNIDNCVQVQCERRSTGRQYVCDCWCVRGRVICR